MYDHPSTAESSAKAGEGGRGGGESVSLVAR